MSNDVLERIDFEELMKRANGIFWCNMTCKTAILHGPRLYWSGKYSDLKEVIRRANAPEIMFECLYVSKGKRMKEIQRMGYRIEAVCETWDGDPEKWSKIYYLTKRKEEKI